MIRRADIDDMPEMVEMGRKFYEEANLSGFGLSMNDEDLSDFLGMMIEAPAMVAFVAEECGKLVGAISGLWAPWFMDMKQAIVTEQWWWVDPDYRGSQTHKGLVDALVYWAESLGSCKLIMAAMGDDRRLDIYYRRQGFKKLETHYVRSIGG